MGAKAKAKRQASNNVVKFNNYLPKKNKSIDIIPRNRNQENYVLSLMNNTKSIVFGIGPAGTGKTLLACQAAVKSFIQNDVDKIIVTRPAVSADEDLGFLPGTLEEKMAPWTRPIFDVFVHIIDILTGNLRYQLIDSVKECTLLCFFPIISLECDQDWLYSPP